MGKFSDKAKAAIQLSDLLVGRNKVGTDDIIERFPQGFTIADFDIINDGKNEYPAFTIKEDPDLCFFGGAILKSMADSWLEGYETLEECRNDFRLDGGVAVRMYTGKTKKGNNITKVDIL